MWYTFCEKRLIGLQPLEAEALKYDNFEDFKTAYQNDIKHGRYWHVTDKPDFDIDLEYAPRDMSSLSNGSGSNPGLMLTSHLGHWLYHYPNRQYVAEIDMSQVPSSEYRQVNRGFGNEFWVTPKGAALAKVVKIYDRAGASKADSKYFKKLPQNREQLKEIFDRAQMKKVK
jgi:hypothetical protein